jgi:hypothetical protein
VTLTGITRSAPATARNLITSHDANPGVTLNDADETHEMVTRAEPLTIDEPNERNLSKIAHPQSVHLGRGLEAPHEN